MDTMMVIRTLRGKVAEVSGGIGVQMRVIDKE